MKISCNVIKDLLPLYAEKLTSEDSNKLIEKHLKECDDCKNKLYNMQSDKITTNSNSDNLRKFKKSIKKHNAILISFSVYLTVSIMLIIFGISIEPGDEMGWGLLSLYIILPLMSLIISLVLAIKSRYLRWIAPPALGIMGSIMPRAVFGSSSFEFIELFFALIPSLIGLIIGLAVEHIKNKRMVQSLDRDASEHLKALIKSHASEFGITLAYILMCIIIGISGLLTANDGGMAWCLIVLYCIFPIVSFAFCVLLGMRNTRYKFIAPLLFFAFEFLTSHLVVQTNFDFIEPFFALIPAILGTALGCLIKKLQSKRKK